MSQPIATRTLYARVDDQLREILVSFQKPAPLASGDWSCECTIEGDGIDMPAPRPGMGIDAVQAIIGALESVGVTLERSKLALAITRAPFLTGTPPDPRELGDFFPRRIDVMHGLFEHLDRLQTKP